MFYFITSTYAMGGHLFAATSAPPYFYANFCCVRFNAILRQNCRYFYFIIEDFTWLLLKAAINYLCHEYRHLLTFQKLHIMRGDALPLSARAAPIRMRFHQYSALIITHTHIFVIGRCLLIS